MCCESCDKFEECELNDKLKDDCCEECPEYKDCVELGLDEDVEESGEGSSDGPAEN